jgi:D-alanyl-D-alanine-carboxypeptidase/D-alanyl-D-alanine-endopeptidase
MKKILLIVVCTLAASTRAQQADLDSAFPPDAELLELIKAQVDDGNTVGMVLGVMEADGSSRIVSYGDAGAGAAPLGPDSVFEIGSITKVFTASVLSYMNATGQLSLGDPVQNYAPQGLVIPRKDGQPITLANLAEQNSGLPALPTNFFVSTDTGGAFGSYSTADLAEFLAGYSLPRAPGASFEYSNLGVGLLGLVLANHAGVSYEALVREIVLQPLEMDSTGVSLTPAMQEVRVVGHDLQKRPVPDGAVSEPFAGAGSLESSMQDMLKFLAANLRAPETELDRAMHHAQQPRADAGSGKIGLNWLRSTLSGGVGVVYHTGSTTGFSSFIGFDPDRHVGVIMLANQIGMRNDLPFHLLDPTVEIRQAPPTPEERGAIQLSAEQLAKFEGVFVVNTPPNMRLNVMIEGGLMFIETAGVGKVPFYPDSPTSAFTTFVDARITLVTDEQNGVTGLVLTMGGQDQEAAKVEGAP